MSKKKTNDKEAFNPAKDFHERFHEEMLEVLHVPMIAVCKQDNELVPYEYSSHRIKYRRDERELDGVLATKGVRLVAYCTMKRIRKANIISFSGGNLWSFDNQTKSYAR